MGIDSRRKSSVTPFGCTIASLSVTVMSKIFWRNKYTPSDEDIDTLAGDNGLDDGDLDIELAVGEAFGNANITNAVRVKLEAKKRKSAFRSRLGQTAEEIEQEGMK